MIFCIQKTEGKKFPTELYSTIRVINFLVEGEIVGLIHPPTYLNKVIVATTQSVFVINVRTGKLLYKSRELQFEGEKISSIEAAPVLDVVAVGTSNGNVFYSTLKGESVGPKIITSGTESLSKVASISLEQMEHLIWLLV